MASPSDYNIDAALYILPRYLHQLEVPGEDFTEVRLSATRCMEDFLRATQKGRKVKLDRTKWLILRALLKALEANLGKAMGMQAASYASTGDGDLWESNKDIIKAIENMDRIDVQYFEGSTPSSVRLASLRRHPETASLQREVEQYKRQVEELQADLKKKSVVVDSLVLQGGMGKTAELQSQLQEREMQYRLLYSQCSKEKARHAELLKQHQEAQKTFELERTKMEVEMKDLEEKYKKTFKELIDAQKFREDLERELGKLNQQLEGQGRLQEEVKNIVQRIEGRQEDFFQELQELHLEALAEAPGGNLSQLPPEVNAICMRIEYFIGVQLTDFGARLLGGDFNRGKYETDRVCFATHRMFWNLIQEWLERRRRDVTPENLRAACERLRYNPLNRVRMSDAKKNQLEKNYTFLVRNVLLSELAPKLWEHHVYDLEGTAEQYVKAAANTGEKVKRLLQVVFSLGDEGFDLLVTALSQSHPDFVARELTSGMQQEAQEREEEEAPAAEDAARAAAAAATEEGSADTELADVEADLLAGPGLSVVQLARVMMTLCRTALQQPPLRPPTPPAQ